MFFTVSSSKYKSKTLTLELIAGNGEEEEGRGRRRRFGATTASGNSTTRRSWSSTKRRSTSSSTYATRSSPPPEPWPWPSTSSRVPNAKPDRESTDIEIFGMQGIPPEIVAEHYGEEEDASSKLAKVEMPATGVVSACYNAGPLGMQPPTWPFTARPQPWFPVPPIVLAQHQPLSSIQNAANLLAATAALVIQPQFQVGARGLSSAGPLSVSPPLFPIGYTSTIENLASTLPASSSPTIFKGHAETNISAEGGYIVPSNQDELN